MQEERVEIEVSPDGRVRSIYKDETIADLKELGTIHVGRASLVEWETIIDDRTRSGWTVRAAHDTSLAIRYQLGGAHCVSKEGKIAVFASREMALEVELKFFWELLPT